jgi:hypothetical protein
MSPCCWTGAQPPGCRSISCLQARRLRVSAWARTVGLGAACCKPATCARQSLCLLRASIAPALLPVSPTPPPQKQPRSSTAADPFGDARWSKWSFWLVRAALPAAAYCYVAALPSTPHRALLPAKPELSRHAACLAAAHALQALGAALVGSRAGAGYCVFGAGAWLYDALFPPLVYCTFLLGFFGADELDTDLLLYSEMREAEFV